jgi:hypothetical protein
MTLAFAQPLDSSADAETVALWHFDETSTQQRPQDVQGHLEPLGLALPVWPDVVDARFGKGRQFSTVQAFKTAETAAGAGKLRLTRSLTVEAVVTYAPVDGAVQQLVLHGDAAALGSCYLYGVAIARVAGQDYLRFRWQRSGLTHATVPDLAVTLPSGDFYLAAVREWISTAEVKVHWYINGQHVGSVTSAHGDIDGGSTGGLTIGARNSVGVYSFDQWRGTIDELRISRGVRSAEEIAHTYATLYVYPELMYELVKACLPPGQSYSTDPSSRVQRQLRVFSDALGTAWAKAVELAFYYHPDVAWSLLDRWEAVTRLSPLPGDSIATRRERVVGHLRKVHGYTRDDIKIALRQLLALDDADIVLVEHSNILTDTFASLASYWVSEPRAGTVGVAGGNLDLDAGVGVDVRWDGAFDKAPRVRATLAEGFRCEIAAAFQISSLPASCWAGIYQLDLVTGYFQIFGLYNQGGNRRLWTRKVDSQGVIDIFGASNPLGAATTYWLRSVDSGAGFGGTIVLPYHRLDGAGYEAGWLDDFGSDPYNIIGGNRCWWGLAIGSDLSALASAISVDVLECRVWCPQWRGVYDWFIYRDPAILPTAYDRVGAQQVVDRMKPAHTRGTIIESLAAVAGSPYSRVGGVPVGG